MRLASKDSVVTPRRHRVAKFRCERLLGEPSIHLCCSRLQVRAERVELPLSGSEPDVLPIERSPIFVGLDWNGTGPMFVLNQHPWEWMESNHLVQDDHRVTTGYLASQSHSQVPHVSKTTKSPPRFFLRRAPDRSGCVLFSQVTSRDPSEESLADARYTRRQSGRKNLGRSLDRRRTTPVPFAPRRAG